LINPGIVTFSPSLSQDFRVHRSVGHFESGGWIEDPEQIITATGIVSVASSRELRQVPEGDRVIGSMVFYSNTPLMISHQAGWQGTSDKIEWNGEYYRLIPLRAYSDYGYFKAIGVRIVGN
jgi:hypothetical protein